ncbi:MAG: metallophosphoesterase family protein [Eubacteriales bacterium]
MKKIVVFSDSHGRADLVRRAAELHRDADAFFHLGDGTADLEGIKMPDIPICAVKGNGEEWFSFSADGIPTERMEEAEEIRMLLVHGHRLGVKSGYERAARYAADKGADILLFGHTHIPHEEYIPEGELVGSSCLRHGIYLFNPGSIGASSYGIITIANGNILLSHGRV